MSGKGKEKVTDKGKRKWTGDDDKTGGKRKNRSVLQFFDDAAYVDDDDLSSDESMYDEQDYAEDEYAAELKSKGEARKGSGIPFAPKEEEMSEEELERMMEERYKPGAGFVTYAEDGYENKRSIRGGMYAPSVKDPAIWKVKCTVGRERYSAFCLMQKYVEMELLKTKLPILSAFSPDYVKGFIFIEADKQNDVYEACKGINTIYASKVTPIPSKDFSRLLSVRSKCSGISKDMWARVKNGTYKGDVALVVAVNDERKKVTVKLIPRIDLKAMAQKFGGGVASKRIIPPQRLISPSELDEFRPLIHSRRDRDTNEMFEVLDGIMLKDGYVYKKVSIDSLSFWGVVPTEDELLKFEPAKKDESTDIQWLSQLFGEKKKGRIENFKPDKGSGKSEGSTSTTMGNSFEVHDLVFFGRKDFGVVIGSEKDDSVKIIKEGSDGPSVVTVKQSDLKRALFDKKLFSVSDQHSNIISINDIVRILDGPLKDREGVVKKIYKGILFLCDESVQENNGYITVKALLCEKVNLSGKESHEKGSEPGSSGFPDMLSPKSPLSPEKLYPERDNESSFQREEDGMFSVGQSLRIRVGPLKGYRCRVLAIRRSDVTVKLDSQQKILTVKSEHLSEVRGRNAVSQGDESGSMKPFGFLATEDGASDWTTEAALPNEASNWNTGGSTQRTSWSAFNSSNSLLAKQPGSVDPVDDSATEGTGWQTKASEGSSSWGAATVKAKQDSVPEASGWGKVAETNGASSGDTIKDNSWGAAANKWGSGGDASGKAETSWGKQMETQPDDKAENADKSWGQSVVEKGSEKSDGWGSVKSDRDNSASGWNASKGSENIKSSGWGGASSGNGESGNDGGSWDKVIKPTDLNKSWNAGTTSSEGKQQSDWSTHGNWKSASEGKSSDWNSEGKKDGGSSTGWGQTNWGGNGASEANGNQESSWGNKGGWTAGGGDRGGRSDRGGFRGGRGGSTCYKCGEEGHMSRECSQGGGGGGRGGSGCFKCGEEGHMSRECPKGGGRGGSGCFKCGEEGHMSRECPQGGGRGGFGCYKCGEDGHMARDCTQGGGGGGRYGSGSVGRSGGGGSCYKCGEEGHFARECPTGN